MLGFVLVALTLTFACSGTLLLQWVRGAIAGAPELQPIALATLAVEEATATAEASAATATPFAPPVAVPTIPAWDPGRKERVNILLMGVDQRPSEKGATRTDTLIVLSIDPTSKQVSMLSIPRDLWVRIPGYDVFGKINTAYVVGEQRKYPGGGPALTKQTVSELIGYPIHYYVRGNFDGFRRFIDLIGGIDIYVPRDLSDPTYPDDNYGFDPLFIPAGQHHMDGELALKYARTRHVDDDFGRARRQQQVILAVKEQVTRADMVPSLVLRLPQLVQTFAGSVETDVPLTKIAALADLARQIEIGHIQQLVIDRELGEERNDPNIGYVLIPDREAIRPLMDRLFSNAPAVEPATSKTPATGVTIATTVPVTALLSNLTLSTATAPITSPATVTITVLADSQLRAEQARIAVLDGGGHPGVAPRVAEWLKGQGFNVVRAGIAPGTTFPHTALRVFASKSYTITRLQAIFDQPVMQDLSNTVAVPTHDIEVVLGEDFDPEKRGVP